MKKLNALHHDSGNCRLYVKDTQNRRYVILDHGERYARSGLPRFELHTHLQDGEPDCPINVNWTLIKGVSGTVFTDGLQHFLKTDRAQRVLTLLDECCDGEARYFEFVRLVAEESGVTTEQLEHELEPFI